jgi:hypothetical protein
LHLPEIDIYLSKGLAISPEINKAMIAVNFWIEAVFATSMEKINISDKKADLII